MSKETIRRATLHDLPFVMVGIEEAKKQLASHQSGQWQNGEPSELTIQNDIELGQYWILILDNHILGGCALVSYEPAYAHLISGQWLNDDPYRVIHRFYIHPSWQQKGYAKQLLRLLEAMVLHDGVHNIRVDTHERNMPMRTTLESAHYKCVGETFLPQAGMRFVYHKVI
jgi:RimJ/RimL family protein N-acetyltransferase